MKTTVEIRDLLMADAKAVCDKHNISMDTLIDRALEAEVEKLAAQQVWQPTDEFIIHGDVMLNTDVDADIAQMYEEMMANDFMTIDEEQLKDLHENNS
jgi:ribosomal protein S13